MRKFLGSVMVLACLSAFAPVNSFAAKCGCTNECHEKCAKGEGKDCKCKHCDCKKGEKCKEGECDRKENAEKAEKTE